MSHDNIKLEYMDRKKEIKPKNEDKSTLSAIYRIKDENIKKMNEYLNKIECKKT